MIKKAYFKFIHPLFDKMRMNKRFAKFISDLEGQMSGYLVEETNAKRIIIDYGKEKREAEQKIKDLDEFIKLKCDETGLTKERFAEVEDVLRQMGEAEAMIKEREDTIKEAGERLKLPYFGYKNIRPAYDCFPYYEAIPVNAEVNRAIGEMKSAKLKAEEEIKILIRAKDKLNADFEKVVCSDQAVGKEDGGTEEDKARRDAYLSLAKMLGEKVGLERKMALIETNARPYEMKISNIIPEVVTRKRMIKMVREMIK